MAIDLQTAGADEIRVRFTSKDYQILILTRQSIDWVIAKVFTWSGHAFVAALTVPGASTQSQTAR